MADATAKLDVTRAALAFYNAWNDGEDEDIEAGRQILNEYGVYPIMDGLANLVTLVCLIRAQDGTASVQETLDYLARVL